MAGLCCLRLENSKITFPETHLHRDNVFKEEMHILVGIAKYPAESRHCAEYCFAINSKFFCKLVSGGKSWLFSKSLELLNDLGRSSKGEGVGRVVSSDVGVAIRGL